MGSNCIAWAWALHPKEKVLPPPLFLGSSRWGDFADTAQMGER
jgi:hypothetical protein